MTKSPAGNPHVIADHAFGAAPDHVHAPGEDHDHDHDSDDNLIADGSQELARVELVSIGVDIGSSGTQIAFSRLFMHGPGEPAAMRRHVKSRETIYMSPVALTPYKDGGEIDIDRLRGTIARAFEAAGLTPDDIDTGAVIMTGAAARRTNAAAIVEALALETGDIVTAAAGDHMEAALAAHGSGAVERSRARMQRILNIDIGGATTKFALVENGHIIQTAAMKVGGRQMAIDARGEITRLDDAAVTHARRCGITWRLSEIARRHEMQSVAERMAQDLFAALSTAPLDIDIAGQYLTEPLVLAGDVSGVMFSGGVAEYIYQQEKRNFGDLGQYLGQSIINHIAGGGLPAPLLPAGECMRATVLGCSEYSVQMSGATSCITSHSALLPRKNLAVMQPAFDFSGAIDPDLLAKSIIQHRLALGDDNPHREIAFAFRWRGDAEHGRILAFAKGLEIGLADRIAAGTNLYLLIEGDAALSLGAVLRQELGIGNEMLVIDGIVLRDFDFADIGRLRMPACMVPVTVKSLLFPPGGHNKNLSMLPREK